jgi:hypothetical protein
MSQAMVYNVGTSEGVPLNSGGILSMLGGGICNDFIIFACNTGGVFIHVEGRVSNDYILLFSLQ